MTEMVERVAEALWRDQKRQDDDAAIDYGSVNHQTERDYKVAITVYLSLARAAIAAMREPTKEMDEAGFMSDFVDSDWPKGAYSVDPTACWQAMIDEALK